MKSTAKFMFSLAIAIAVIVGASSSAPALEVGDPFAPFPVELAGDRPEPGGVEVGEIDEVRPDQR